MLNNKCIFYFVMAICINVAPIVAYAVDFSPGTEIQSIANVNFRKDMKYNFWSDPKILKIVRPGDRLTVIKTKKLKVPFVRNRIWLNVRDPETGETGWVYNGKTGDAGYFVKVKTQNGGAEQ